MVTDMSLQELAKFVAKVSAITNGGAIELQPGHDGDGLRITVNWEQSGRRVGFMRELSRKELSKMEDCMHPLVLESVYRDVKEIILANRGD
jgi:hypothetical protein